MKYPTGMYTQNIGVNRLDFRPLTQRNPETGKLITMFFGRAVKCASGEDIFAAAERYFGSDIHIPLERATFAPELENVLKYGDPIGTVSPRAKESFYIYRRASTDG